LGLEDVAIVVFIASHAQSEPLVTAATELEMSADGDFLELHGERHEKWSGQAWWARRRINGSAVYDFGALSCRHCRRDGWSTAVHAEKFLLRQKSPPD